MKTILVFTHRPAQIIQMTLALLRTARRRPTGKIVLAMLLALVLLFCRSHAGRHYCESGHSVKHIGMVASGFTEELLIPSTPDELPAVDCSEWQLTFDGLNESRQLLLQGIPNMAGSEATTLEYKLAKPAGDVTTGSTSWQRAFPGMFRVLPVTDSQMTVEVALKKEKDGFISQSADLATQSVSLKAVMPHGPLCSRTMLKFRGNCYAVSQVLQNLTEVMSSVGGDAQLGSFTSFDEIKEFVSSNAVRKFSYLYKPPLNLSQPVRVGMFRRRVDGTILSIVRARSGCQLMNFSGLNDIRAVSRPGVCVSLRVDKLQSVVLDFDDCSQPMPSLMSFPEKPSTDLPQWESCSDWRAQQLASLLAPREVPVGRLRLEILVPVLVLFALCNAVLVFFIVKFLCRSHQRRSVQLRETIPDGGQAKSAHSDAEEQLFDGDNRMESRV